MYYERIQSFGFTSATIRVNQKHVSERGRVEKIKQVQQFEAACVLDPAALEQARCGVGVGYSDD